MQQEDLIKKMPDFFENTVLKRLTNDFHSVYQYAAVHFGGRDLYMEGIQKNVKKVTEDPYKYTLLS